MPEQINDGTGKGFSMRVDSNNRAHVDSIVETISAELSREGKLFGAGTGSVTLDGAESLSPMLWLRNDDPDNNFHIQKLIFGWNGGSTTSIKTILSFIKYQTTVPTGANTLSPPAIENISKSGATAAVTDTLATVHKWDGTGSAGMTGSTGGYLQIPNRIAKGNTSIPIDGEIILGQNDTMAILVTPEEAGLFNVAIVYYKAPIGGRL